MRSRSSATASRPQGQAPATCPTCGLTDTLQQDFCSSCGEYLRWDLTTEHAPTAVPAPPPSAVEPATAEPPTVVAAEPVLLVLDGGTPTATVAAGQRAAITGVLRNQSGIVDNYDIRVTGVPDAWTTLPPTAYLLPIGSVDGAEQRFDIGLHPPRSSEAEARPWPLTVEAVSRASGDVVARAQATLVIEPFRELVAEARPQRRRSRRTARFDLALVNRGNAPVDMTLSAEDAEGACATRVEKPALRVAPGERGTARLRVKPRRTIWWGRPADHQVGIAINTGDAVAVTPPQPVTLRQLPWIPWWVPVALLLIVGLAIALLALRGERITIPEVRGATVEAAQRQLVNAGLKSTPQVQELVVADSRQVGRVVGQDPAAGSTIAADGGIILQAGVANQVVAVPDVLGATRDDAQRILESSGLTLGAIEPGDASSDARVDFQNPAAGGQARLGSPVSVILVDEEVAEADEGAGDDPPAAETPAEAPPVVEDGQLAPVQP